MGYAGAENMDDGSLNIKKEIGNNMSLTKKDISERVAHSLHISEAKSIEIVDTLIKIINQTFQSGDDLLISGFGKFCVKDKEGRNDRNLISNEQGNISARRLITLKYSPKLENKIQRFGKIISMGLDPDAVVDLIDFSNQITPPNWVIYEFGSYPELKPGNLYIQVFFFNNDTWFDKDIGGRVVSTMKFIKISDIANIDTTNVYNYLKTKCGDDEIYIEIVEQDLLRDIIELGSKNAKKCLNKYGDGKVSVMKMEIFLDDEAYDINYIKQTMVHELAHVIVTRQAAQKLRAWKFPFFTVMNQGLDSEPHGPIFKRAYELLIKRVEEVEWDVAFECREALRQRYHQ